MSGALQVNGVRLYPLENARRHHTDKFEAVHAEKPAVVLRRGQEFDLLVIFRERTFDVYKDMLTIVFEYDNYIKENCMEGVHKIRVKGNTMFHSKDWDARVLTKDARSIKLEIRTSPEALVGEWKLSVETRELMSPRAKPDVYKYPGNIYLLFNPWNRRDTVFMKDEKLLEEYVLNDLGKIWKGSYSLYHGREWFFGQFNDCVLPATMMMLDRAMKFSLFDRANPIKVTRALTRIVNSEDEERPASGVVESKWGDNYPNGTKPTAWTGSVSILRQYLSTGEKVKYGQCWVLAGVLTTVCRALGIPSRPVTNFESAHDTDGSLTVDEFIRTDENGKTRIVGNDSVWNFHVWTEAWMARNDLPPFYGGWQAIDATPQITSDGFYQCGPASVDAVKRGEVGFVYDVPFILAAVNADFIRWKEDPTSDIGYRKIYTDETRVGKCIFTKRAGVFDNKGDTDREDITENYKAKESTPYERSYLMNAVRNLNGPRAQAVFELDASAGDVHFELVSADGINIGEDFSVAVKFENNSNEIRTLTAELSAFSMFYNGTKANLVKSYSKFFRIQPNINDQLTLIVTADDYLNRLVDDCIVKINAILTVEETGDVWVGDKDFQIKKPKLDIQLKKSIPVNAPTTAIFSFTNPLEKDLEECSFTYEISGLPKPVTFNYRNILPAEKVEAEHTFTPKIAGEMKLVACFTSKQLVDVTGSAFVNVFWPRVT